MDANKVQLQTILRDNNNKEGDEQKQTKKRVSFKCFVEFYTYPEHWNEKFSEMCPLLKDTLVDFTTFLWTIFNIFTLFPVQKQSAEMTDISPSKLDSEDIVNS